MRLFSSCLMVCALGSFIGTGAGCNADGRTVRLPGEGEDLAGIVGPGDDGGIPLPNGTDGAAPMSCPAGTYPSGNGCLPNEVTCAAEFPCPMGETCVGGACVSMPGPCTTNDDCPDGFQCTNGTCTALCPNNPECQTDADCGTGQLCVACMCVAIGNCATPTPALNGKSWNTIQHLHLDQALGAFGQAFAGIMKQLRDGVLGCPAGSAGDCFLFQIVASFLPSWAQNLIVGIGNFADLLDNDDFMVASVMSFTKNNKPDGYDGVDNWMTLTFSYMNMQVMESPQNVPQIGKAIIIPFEASAVCGVLYVDKHAVQGVLAGILEWIVDTIVQLESCPNGGPCYMDLADAITGAIDCSLVQDLAAQAACYTFTSGLANTLQNAINSWLLDYSLMTLKGTALVNASGHTLDKGHWDGTLGNGNNIFNNFDGEWSAIR